MAKRCRTRCVTLKLTRRLPGGREVGVCVMCGATELFDAQVGKEARA